MSHGCQRPLLVCVLLFILAASARIGYVFVVQTYRGTQGFAGEMERAALSVAQEGMLGNVYGKDSGPSAHVAPLYPCGLAFVYRVFAMPSWPARLVQQILASLATALAIALLPLLGQRLGLRPAAGYVAAVLLALSPANLWIETSGSWEQPYAALALLGLLFALAVLHDRCWNSSAMALLVGAAAGLATLLSPICLLAVGLAVLAELWTQTRRRPVVVGAAFMAAGALLCLAPWAYRNHATLGGWVWTRSNFGLELRVGNHPRATGMTFSTCPENPQEFLLHEVHPYGNRRELARLRQVGELAYMDEKKHQAIDWIRDHPDRFAALTARRLQAFWFPPADLWARGTPAVAMKSMLFSLIGLGTFAGCVMLFWTRHPYRWLWIAAVIGPSLPYMITHVDTRYRYPIFALSTLLACDVAVRLIQYGAHALRRKRGSFSRKGEPCAMPD